MANQSQPSQRSTTATTTAAAAETAPSGVGEYARKASDTAVTAVDLQVGAALTAADRVRELVKPWRQRQTAGRELKSLRSQVTREVNKAERRGGTARRRLTRRARRTRNRVERRVSQQRRSVETTVERNRRKAEQRLKTARTQFGERVPLA
jgi:chromosome segregation ATPase